MTSTNEDDVKTDAWTGRSKRRNLHTLYHKNPSFVGIMRLLQVIAVNSASPEVCFVCR